MDLDHFSSLDLIYLIIFRFGFDRLDYFSSSDLVSLDLENPASLPDGDKIADL